MKRRLLTGLVLTLLTLISLSNEVVAQCAMCRAQLENNVSSGRPGIAAGINTGILYLLVMPYLSALVLGYFWYKNSKRNANPKGLTAG
ncbi:MAG: hypothetical protein U0U09_17475 [Cyclobacteriaceae bacterium]